MGDLLLIVHCAIFAGIHRAIFAFQIGSFKDGCHLKRLNFRVQIFRRYKQRHSVLA